MNTPTLTPMSIVATMTVSEENNNTTITIPSPSGVTTPFQAPTTPATNNSTNSHLLHKRWIVPSRQLK